MKRIVVVVDRPSPAVETPSVVLHQKTSPRSAGYPQFSPSGYPPGYPSMMEKRILGIDPGLATLGFGALFCQADPDRPTCASILDFGVIQTPPNHDTGDRLCTIYDDLHQLLNHLQPDLVAIEKLFFYRMGNTIAVAQARGVIMLVLAQHHIPFIEFTPAQVKQSLTGYGNADKLAVQQAVARELDLKAIPRPDDAADALALALAAWFQN